MPTLLTEAGYRFFFCSNEHEPKHAHVIKGKSVHFDDQHLSVELEDGRVISTPMAWYKELQNAPFGVLKNYQFICRGTGVEWPELDCQLSIESMLVAVPAQQAA